MDKDKIITIIKNILSEELNLHIKDIEPEKNLLELGIDSITFMMLLVFVEERLSIEIDLADGLNEEYSKVTFAAFIDAICKKLQYKNK